MNVLKLLPNKFKVWALKNLYSDIASKGDEGDTALAHVNSFEVALLRAVGGSGTINAKTGLLEFKGGGGSSKPSETKALQLIYLSTHSLTIEELMKQAGKQTYTTDSAGRVTGVQEYTPYEGDSCSWVYRSTASNTRSSGWLANSRVNLVRSQAGLQQGTNLGLVQHKRA